MRASICVLAAIVVGGMTSIASANDELLKLEKDANQWVMPTGDYANHRYSTLNQINKDNVKDLRPAWTFSTGVLRGHEGAPLVIGDVMYVHAPFPNYVYALDLNKSGQIIWKYEPKQDPSVIPVMCCDTVNRGVAYAEGKIILNQADAHVVALDAKTGKEIWRVANGDPKKGETMTSAPMVVKDKVIVGISGGEFGVQGRVTAYNLADGKMVWNAASVGPDDQIKFDPEKTLAMGKPVGKDSSIKTWQGDQWKIGGGATWGWYSYDPQLNLVYYGSGNPSTWNPSQRPGDNKWSMTIFARDPDTGMAKWVYQMTPHDEWDYDGVNEMILADIPVKGQPTKALVHFDRNGFGYTLNRETGALLIAEKFDPKVNWATHVDMQAGKPYVGATLSMYPPPGDNNLGNFIAWDAGAGKIVWSDPEPFSVWSGALATAGDVVFYGTLEGYLKAVDIQTGKELYKFKTPSGIIGNVNAFTHGGKEYMAVLSGVGGWAGIGMAAGLTESANAQEWHRAASATHIPTETQRMIDTAGLGATGAYKALANYTQLGGVLTVFGLPE